VSINFLMTDACRMRGCPRGVSCEPPVLQDYLSIRDFITELLDGRRLTHAWVPTWSALAAALQHDQFVRDIRTKLLVKFV